MPHTRDVGPRLYVAALMILAIGAIVFAIQTWSRAMRPDGNDFTSYLLASRTLWSDGNPYVISTPFPFIYPLFLCVALWPLTLVPYGVSVGIWYALCLAALGVSLAFARTLQNGRRWVVAATVVCLALTEVLQNNFANGQVNTLVLALCMGFAWLWIRGHRMWASVLLGAAIAVKITPALLLVFLARRRAWRPILESLSAAAVLAIGLPWLIRGPEVVDDYRHYVSTFMQDRLADASTVVSHNRAFGLVELWRQISSFSWAADAVLFGAVLALILAMVDQGPSDSDRAMTTACLYLGVALLITPMSEIHHLVALAPGLVLLTYRTMGGRPPLTSRIALGAVMLLLAGLRYIPFAAFAGVVGTCALLISALHEMRDDVPSGD